MTTPAAVTVAIDASPTLHVTNRPMTTLPRSSLVTAESGALFPKPRVTVGGCTVTVATDGTMTVMLAVPDLPSAVAVIVAVPELTPMTKPAADTVATAVALELHVMGRSVVTVPFASFTVAASVAVRPTRTVAVAGATDTDPTATPTSTVAVAATPSQVAVIVARPAATPVTAPADVTVAICVLLDFHVTTRPPSGRPEASFGVAVTVMVVPTRMLAGDGWSVSETTDPLRTVTAAVPDCPPVVAVIVTTPGLTPVTSPLGVTVARPALLVLHVTTRVRT